MLTASVKEMIFIYALEFGNFRFANLKGETPMKVFVDRLLSKSSYAKKVSLELCYLLGKDMSSVGGVATGGMPWASRIADFLEIPEFYVKKDGSISGAEDLGENPGLVEDVVTTGESLGYAVESIRKTGREPNVGAIFSYGLRKDIKALVYLEDILDNIEEPPRNRVKEWYRNLK